MPPIDLPSAPRRRSWRHLDTCQFKTLLVADVPRVECPEHGVVVEHVPVPRRASKRPRLPTVPPPPASMTMSWPTPVVSIEPAVFIRCVEPTVTPSPYCVGLTPPRKFDGRVAPWVSWTNASLNVTRDDL